MTDQDRGAYTPPTDAPLSFDARQPVRGSRPVPITLIISAFVLILLVVAIVVFYRSGVRQAGMAPQAVGTPVGPMKSAPPADAQPVDPAAGLQIYKPEGGETAAQPTFTAPPEEPQARPAPLPPPAAAPTTTIASAQPLPPPKPAAAAGLKPAQPAPPPKAAPAPPAKAAPAPPVAKVAPPPAPKPAAPAAPAAASGGFGVQIGAFSSQAQADDGFRAAAAISPAAVSGKGKRVEPVAKGASTLYRTTVTGFASRADAQAFCNQLKAAGKSCFVK